jgi:hypothetical protein
MTLRRRKSKKAKAADLVGSYVKLQAAGKAAKGAKKAAKGTAAYQVAKRTPLVRRIPVIAAGAAVAAFVAAKLLRGGGDHGQPASA